MGFGQGIVLQRPLPAFFESWQALSSEVWTITNPAIGGDWGMVIEDEVYMNASPSPSEIARLATNSFWTMRPTLWNSRHIYRKLSAEWEMTLTGVVNLDETTTFFGFGYLATTRASINIAGFAILADALQTVTDRLSVETVNTGFGEDLTVKNKFKIEVSENSIKFYLNEILIANHITDLPDYGVTLYFHLATTASGIATIRLGPVRIWYGDTS